MVPADPDLVVPEAAPDEAEVNDARTPPELIPPPMEDANAELRPSRQPSDAVVAPPVLLAPMAVLRESMANFAC